VKYVCLLWYMCVVQRNRGIIVISVKYRFLSVNWVKWEIALKPRINIILGVKFILP
jgi:hypothetical protein